MAAGKGRSGFGWREIAASLNVLIVYSICLYQLPRHVFWSPDEGGKFLHAMSIRWAGGIDYVLPYAGERLDPDLRFYAYGPRGARDTKMYPVRQPDGHFRFHWPMWFPLTVRVPMAVFGSTGGYLVAMLAGWLAVILSGLLAREVDVHLAAPVILVVGLATPIWFYSLCFWEHTAAAALGLLAILILVRRRADLRGCLLCLPLVVGAVMMRIELAALVPALCAALGVVALCRRRLREVHRPDGVAFQMRRRTGRFTALASLSVAIALAAVTAASLTGRHTLLLQAIPSRFTRLARFQYLPQAAGGILTAPLWTESSPPSADGSAPTPTPWRGTSAGLAALICCLSAPFARRVWIEGPLTVVGLAVFAVYSGALLLAPQPDRSVQGIFSIAPFMILAAHGLHQAWRQRRAGFFILGAVAVFYLISGIVVLVVMYGGRYGYLTLGLAWGQRYLLLLYPLLTVLSLAGLQAYWRSARPRSLKRLVVGLTALLVAIGTALQVRGFEESSGTRQMLAAWQTEMEGDSFIVTDIWWLPAGLAELYTRKPVFVVAGRHEVAEWVQRAADQGISNFTFASLSPVDLRDFGEPAQWLGRSDRVVDGLYLTRISFLPQTRRSPWR